MSEKLDVTMGEMTKTNGKSGRKVPKKSYGRSARWLWWQLF